jgi:hypothetical protein
MKKITGKQLLLLCLMRNAPVKAKNNEIYDYSTEGGSLEEDVRDFYFILREGSANLVSKDQEIIWWNHNGIFYTGTFEIDENLLDIEVTALKLLV